MHDFLAASGINLPGIHILIYFLITGAGTLANAIAQVYYKGRAKSLVAYFAERQGSTVISVICTIGAWFMLVQLNEVSIIAYFLAGVTSDTFLKRLDTDGGERNIPLAGAAYKEAQAQACADEAQCKPEELSPKPQ